MKKWIILLSVLLLSLPVLAQSEDPLLELETLHNRVTDMAFSTDGTVLATTSVDFNIDGIAQGSALQLWDMGEFVELLAVEDSGGLFARVAFSPDGTILATASTEDSASVTLWDVEAVISGDDAELITWEAEGQPEFAFSPDGSAFVYAHYRQMTIVDLETLEETIVDLENDISVTAVDVSPDNSVIALGGITDVHFYDLGSGESLLSLADRNSPGIVAFLPQPDMDADSDADMTIELVVGNQTIDVIDVLTEEVSVSIEVGASLRSAAISPDASLLATTAFRETDLTLWDLATGEALLTFPVGMSDFYATAFSPDGTILVTGGGGTLIFFGLA